MNIKINFEDYSETFDKDFQTLEEAIEYLNGLKSTYEYCKGSMEKTIELINF